MSQPVFDAEKFITFDLKKGAISSSGEEPLALVPIDIIGILEPSAALAKAAKEWGELHGSRLQANLGGSSRPGGMGALADHLGGTFAVFGLGRVRIEVRGDALMFRAEWREDEVSPGKLAMCGEFLAGYLSAVSEKPFEVLSLGTNLGEQLFWAGSRDALKKVRKWMDEGTEPLAAVERLTTGGVS